MDSEGKKDSEVEKFFSVVFFISISFAAIMIGFNNIQSMTLKSEEIKSLKELNQTLDKLQELKSNNVSQGETK